ncbi:hypothetical protein BJV78DRAFT_1282825 [Lactifluus subvellereus]|nr:hypothetical protein BJV78DRAFT_1282825 [Lactifluus subvellereus]
MSRSATASTPKIPSQLPSKSAWARGPPQQNSATTTPRSQSPAPPTPVSATNPTSYHATHSRRPSALGQGVSIKDGVGIPRNAVKQGSAVTFGSIDDALAPISSSPASAPAVKSAEGVKSFGSVAFQNGDSDAAKSAVTNRPTQLSSAPSTSSSQAAAAPASTPPPVPKFDKKSIAKLFQGPSTQSAPPPEAASPASRPASLPSQTPSQGQPYQPTFTPSTLRQGQNGNPSAPRSPVYSRPMANGQSSGVGVSGRPQAGSGGPSAGPAPTALSSPRLTPHPPPGPPSGLPPPAMWSGYYYHPSFVPGVPPDQFYQPQWPGHLLPPQHQPPPPHHPPGPPPPSAGLPMSPRNPPLPLQQVPGTPTQSHAIPPIHHPPHTSAPHPPPSVTSPPPTPSVANRSTSLSASAGPFVPKKISIKNASGQEVNLDALKRASPPAPPPVPPSPASVKKDIKRPPVRIESQEQKEKRLAEERAKEGDSEEKSKTSEVVAKANEDAARRLIEEEHLKAEKLKAKEEAERAEREQKEADERAAQEEKERKEAEERAAREEVERKEAEERAAREAREKERIRLEEERAQREAEEKAERERAEQERLCKLQEEEEARANEEAERQRKAEEALKAAEAAARPLADEAPDVKPDSLPEEGEIEDDMSQPAASTAEESAPADKSGPAPPLPHIPVELPAKPLEKEPLRIDTSLPSPEHPRKRPGPLNLQTAINTNIAPSLPSALASARHIEDISRITYPEGIKSPKVELNVNTQKGKFRYDRDFLLQFMNICKEKPDNLPPLDVIGLEPSDTSHTMSRGGSGCSRASNSMTLPARSASIGLGFLPASMGKNAGSGFQMGQFSTSASRMSSEERFLASSTSRSASVSSGPLGGRAPVMVRTISQGGTGRDRTRQKRGGNDSNRGSVVGSAGPTAPIPIMGPPMELVAPLEASANRWVASSTRRNGSGLDGESPEMVERKVKGLLNKLTMERFDSISDQIIAWANKSEKEKDGRTLIQVIKLVFEKATDEATFSEMYARLCRKMMEQISPKVQDDGIKNAEGKPFAGGQLFRKYLLNRCQEDFERGWVAKEATAAAAATKATEDQAVKEANEKTKSDEESELYSDEYYAAAKAKRRGLGLIRFIGELFKLQMLTERIMHECIKKLLGNVENPEEEEIESLCKLLTTVGSLLDTPKARAHLDVYFSRMRELTKNKNVNARMIFMLQDVVELRERKWVPRNTVAAPTTIAQVHEAVAKEKLAQEKDSYMRQNASMSRGGSRRGGNRDTAEAALPDGWSLAGTNATRPPPKAGDLSQFGKINKATPMTFGPSSIFAGKKGDSKNRDSSMSRTPSMSSNMFSMLQSSDATVEPPVSKSSRPPSRKPSVDLGTEESKVSTPAVSEVGSDDETSGGSGTPAMAVMSEEDAKAKIEEDVKEFFGIRMLDEAESYFSSLPTDHRHRLVDILVTKSIEMKEPDVKLVGDLFVRVREKDLCSPEVFEEGLNGLAELLDDLAVDIPKAWSYFVMLLKGTGLDQDEERLARIAEKTMDPDKLNRLL